ncbi:MAG: fructose-bisphosphatase class III [Eubacteriales bacterium]|nr:fructose-bisphosphatase class III [Eubacteriales bacterium]
MTYVCSDIHGYYGEYMDALGLLGKDDTLYIIGDVLDRGPDGIEILLDIMNRKNVVLLKGNHEYMLTDTLSELAGTSSNEAESIIESSLSFEPYGQGETLRAFAELDADMQYNIIDFINRLPYYAEL